METQLFANEVNGIHENAFTKMRNYIPEQTFVLTRKQIIS